MDLVSVLNNNQYAVQLSDYIRNKQYNKTIQDLSTDRNAFSFFRKTLRGSYLFARIVIPSFGAHVFKTLTRMPPLDDEMGKNVATIMDVIREEICNSNIYERDGECHSHFLDLLEAYKSADGEMTELEAFFDLDKKLSNLSEAIELSSFWTQGSKDYASELIECCRDPLVLFMIIPVTELMVPVIFKKALETLSPDPRFDKFRKFLNKHIALDGDDHGPAVLNWLDTYIKRTNKHPNVVEGATADVLNLISSGQFP